MARPRKLEPRDKRLNMSLTAAEYETIVQRAAALGMKPVHFGRAVLLAKIEVSVPKPEAKDNIQRLLWLQLSRLGNNLNQLVRHLHQTGDPLPADLEPLLIDIRNILRRGFAK